MEVFAAPAPAAFAPAEPYALRPRTHKTRQFIRTGPLQRGGGRRAGRPGDARGRCAARQWQEALRGAPAPAAFSGMVHVHAYLALNHTCEHEAPPNTTNPRPKWQSPCMGVAAGAGIAARLPLAAGACVCARVSFP